MYAKGLMIPHIAAGDNLNMPLVGRFLRGGGAFFMRRSFRQDPLYASVFAEYVYQLAQRGHCLEFFPEGGRSRTGRLLPAKFGLLKMCVDSQQRGLPKPLAFVPVYFGYEIVLEGSSYLFGGPEEVSHVVRVTGDPVFLVILCDLILSLLLHVFNVPLPGRGTNPIFQSHDYTQNYHESSLSQNLHKFYPPLHSE